MNPQQHANRAEELAAEAAQMYTDLRRDIEAGTAVDDTMWRFLDTTIHLGHLHAGLALRILPTGPSYVPNYETLDPDLGYDLSVPDLDLLNPYVDESVTDGVAPEADTGRDRK